MFKWKSLHDCVYSKKLVRESSLGHKVVDFQTNCLYWKITSKDFNEC